MTTRRFGRWVSPGAAVLLYAVVISAALSCLSSGSWGFGGAEELEGRVSEGEEAKIIKSSLQQIRSRLLSQDRRNHGELGKTDRDQLGALVDAAVARQSSRTLIEGAGAGQHDHWSAGGGSDESGRDLLQWVDQAGGSGGSRSGGSEGGPRFWESSERSRAASSAKGCGSSCLETLEDRLGGSRTVGGSHVGATGKENVWGIGVAEDDVDGGPTSIGAERFRKGVEQQDSESDRAKFTAAQHQKMESAVKAGWKELNQGHTGQAKDSLRQAKFFHQAMLHLMQGSTEVVDHLDTSDSAIRELRDAIYSSSTEGDVTPAKLKKIMDAHYSPSQGDVHGARDPGDHASRHFARDSGQSDGAGGAWNAGQTQAIEIPEDKLSRDSASSIISLATKNLEGGSKSEASSSPGDSNVVSFEALLKSQIKHGKHALGKLDTHMAEKALEKASVYLSTLEDMGSRDSSHRDGDKQRIASLKLEFEILRHAVDNARGARARGRREQLDRNMQALHAPIEHQSVAEYALGSGGEGSRGTTRGLFTRSVEKGIRAANEGNVIVAKGKLGEAKEYAKIDGYLMPSWEQKSSSDASKARMAQRSLKLLAQAVIAAERLGGSEGKGREHGRGGDGSRGDKGIIVDSEARRADRSNAKRWEDMYSSGSRFGHEANGEKEESSLSDKQARRGERGERGEQTTRRGGRFAPRLNLADPVSSHSSTYRDANGGSEETRWRNKRAKRQEKERCNTLSCLFGLSSSADEGGHASGEGGEKSGSGINGRLHFGSKTTHMHTGLGISRRLKMSGSGAAKVPENLEDRKKAMGLSGASPGSPSSKWASKLDAVKMVNSQDKADLSKSMQEAKIAYKRLLKHEVRKEEQRVISGPMIAIESPSGGSVVADTGKEASRVLHDSKLTRDMDASDAFKKAPSTHKRIGNGAEALINSYLGESKLGKLPAERSGASRKYGKITAHTDDPAAHASAAPLGHGVVPAASASGLGERVVEHASVAGGVDGAERHGGDERAVQARGGEHESRGFDREDDGPDDSLGGMLIRDLGKDLGLDG